MKKIFWGIFFWCITSFAVAQNTGNKLTESNKFDTASGLFLVHVVNKLSKINFFHDNYDQVIIPLYSMIKYDECPLNSYRKNGLFFSYFQDSIFNTLEAFYKVSIGLKDAIKIRVGNQKFTEQISKQFSVKKKDIDFSYLLINCKIIYQHEYEDKLAIPNLGMKSKRESLFFFKNISFNKIISITFYQNNEPNQKIALHNCSIIE